MNKRKLEWLRQWFDDYAYSFRGHESQLPFALQLKLDHSRRVAALARRIAADLQWPEEEIQTAEALGLLHDVARFSQFVEFGTFHDPRSVNHGERGWQMCQDFKLLEDCAPEDQWKVLEGVRFHNRRTIPEDATAAALPFVKLIRDADKLDIFEIVETAMVQNQFREHPEVLLHVKMDGTPSPVLLEKLEHSRAASYKHLNSLADFLLLQLYWVYDLNYTPSFRVFRERGTLDSIAARLPAGDRISRIVDMARRHVEAHAK